MYYKCGICVLVEFWYIFNDVIGNNWYINILRENDCFMDFFIIKVNVNFIFNEIDLWVIGIYMYLGFWWGECMILI